MPITAQGLDDADNGDEVGQCPECGADVYLIAARCPKCGYWFTDDDRAPMGESRRIRGELRIVTVAVVVLIAIFVLSAIVVVVAK